MHGCVDGVVRLAENKANQAQLYLKYVLRLDMKSVKTNPNCDRSLANYLQIVLGLTQIEFISPGY